MWIFATAVFLVLVFFLYRHTKSTLKVFTFLAVGLVLIVGRAMIYFKVQSTPSSPYVDRDSMIAIYLNYDVTSCDKEHPLRVIIRNGADKTLDSVSWYVSVYPLGRSNNIARYPSYTYSSDYNVDPSKTVGLCYKVPELNKPHDPSGLRWQVKLASANFRY